MSPGGVKASINGFNAATGFCVWVELVARIGHVDDIGDWGCRESRIAFCRQVSLLVLIFEEARFRCVLLTEDQVLDDAKPCTTPGMEEFVDLGPARTRS